MKFKIVLSGESTLEIKENYIKLSSFIKENNLQIDLEEYKYDKYGFFKLESSIEDFKKIKEYIIHASCYVERKSTTSTLPSS